MMNPVADNASSRVPRLSLRWLFALVTAAAGGCSFLYWQERSVKAWIWLLLIVVVPGSIVIERLFMSPVRDGGTTRRSILRGLTALLLCGAAVGGMTVGGLLLTESFLPFGAPQLMWLVLILPIEALTLDTFGNGDLPFLIALGVIAAVVFEFANVFVISQYAPRPMPLRIAILAIVFALLSATYGVCDWRGAIESIGWPTVTCWYAMNLLIVALILGLCWRWRRSVSRSRVLIVALLLHTWFWTLAFPGFGGFLFDEFFRLGPVSISR